MKAEIPWEYVEKKNWNKVVGAEKKNVCDSLNKSVISLCTKVIWPNTHTDTVRKKRSFQLSQSDSVQWHAAVTQSRADWQEDGVP